MNYSLQEQAITRGLRGVTRKDKLPNTYERQYFTRNKNNPHEIINYPISSHNRCKISENRSLDLSRGLLEEALRAV